jgi:DNA (cytosine-5)-methyltransferase 1
VPDQLEARRPVAVDLFAGAGGLSLGLEQAGFDVLAAVEYDPVHAAVHEFNFPRTKTVCADAGLLSADDLRAAVAEGWRMHGHAEPFAGPVDLIAGGPPCQGFSTIGKRLIDDERNRLVFHFFRLVTELRPRYFLMENVPGMMQGGHAGILSRLVDSFQEAGYRLVQPQQVLQAGEYGVPQGRKRLFVLGALDGETLPTYPPPLFRPRKLRTRAPADLPMGPSVWDAIGDLPDLDEFDALAESDSVRLPAATLRKMRAQASAYAQALNGAVLDPADLSHPRVWDERELTSSMQTAHTPLSVERFGDTEPGTTEPISRFYRLPPDGLCNTLRAGTGSERGAYTSPRPIHPVLNRVISVREAARLHSFPDWFRLHQTKWHGFRQVGNAVPPLLGRAVGSQIVAALQVAPPKPAVPMPLGSPSLVALTMSEAARHFGAEPAQMPKKRGRPRQGAGV